MAARRPRSLPSTVDTVVVGEASIIRACSIPHQTLLTRPGNGPSALILSYILSGHLPSYDVTNPHPDPILHEKLSNSSNLLELELRSLTEHFASSLRYSTQALPINVLLDTLIRPNADTDFAEVKSCLKWDHRPDRAISHLVLGNASRPGGQWSESPMAASWSIGALSYAEMLSLPGYSFADHYLRTHGFTLPHLTRPNRREVADYYAAYPMAVGIGDFIVNSVDIENVSRNSTGFLIGSLNIQCKHLVLASGIFSFNIPPPLLLQPLATLRPDSGSSEAPLLIIGSGFTAADIILSTHPRQSILHVFRWAPESRPSPLRGCHRSAYPEYAGIYRKMRLAALKAAGSKIAPAMARRKSIPLTSERDWDGRYEGLPNAEVLKVSVEEESAKIILRLADGRLVERQVSGLNYAVGRRSSLRYLSPRLMAEVLGLKNAESQDQDTATQLISGKTLRAEAEEDLEIAPRLFIIGSLTGDSLIRFAYGGCVYAASKIMDKQAIELMSHANGKSEPLSASL